jgi:hypothetical protein
VAQDRLADRFDSEVDEILATGRRLAPMLDAFGSALRAPG